MKRGFWMGMFIFMLINFLIGCGSDNEDSIPKVTSIQITPSAITLKAGESKSIKAVAIYDDGSTSDEGITWKSSVTGAAIVTNDGIVTGIKEGKSIISASKEEKTESMEVTVEKSEVEFEKFTKLNLAGTVTDFNLDENSEMKYMGNGIYEIEFTAPAPSTETWVTENGANQAMKFVANDNWNESYIAENGIIRLATGMENIYATLDEAKTYTIIADFKNLKYYIFESYESFNITGTIDSFALTPMNYNGNGIYQITVTAPAPSTESWVTENGANQAIKFVPNGDWNNSYVIDEQGKLKLASGMENIYVTWEEGKKYSIIINLLEMKCTIEKMEYTKFNITGTIDNFALTPMTYLGEGVYEVKIEAPAPSTETWVTENGANQAIKFVPDEDWNNSYVGDNEGNLRLATGMENIYVIWEEGETYLIKADIKNMTYSIEKVDNINIDLKIFNVNEFANTGNKEIKFMFKSTRGADAKIYIGETEENLLLKKEIEKYDYTKEEGFKVDGFEAGKTYYYKVEIEKQGKKIQSNIYSLTKIKETDSNKKPEWARTAIFYEIFVRSFYDGNGDGIGDFYGLKEKIPYLKELGVTALWIMPMNETPSYHGYDVIDYRTIEKDYGGMEAFESFLEEAHNNNIKVIMDMVLNHVADESEWFKDAVNNETSEYKDYFVWATELDDVSEKWYKADNGEMYYGFYESGMPDLNYRNSKVRERIKEEVKFWIDKGIDGFRLDGSDNIDLDNDVEQGWWREFSDYINEIAPDAFIVGENNFPGEYERVAPFFGVMQSSFNFYLYDEILTMAKGTYYDLLKELEEMYIAYESYSSDFLDSTFTGNHDKPRMISALKNSSERPDIIDIEKAKQAFSILMTLPGTPFFYYGEELGQYGGVAEKDENKREPFDWYKSAAGEGMTTMEKGGFGASSKHTIADDGISLEEQIGVNGSIFEHYKKMIEIRKNHPYIFTQRPERIGTPTGVYGYEIKGSSNNLYVIHNIGETLKEVEIQEDSFDLLSEKQYTASEKINLKAYQTIVFESKEKPIKDYPITEIELEKSTVKIKLNVPINTPSDEGIFIPGTFNDWGNTEGIEVQTLTKISDYIYEIELTMEQGTTIEFKFVRGTDGKRDWAKDGLDQEGNRIGTNFMYTFEAENKEIEITVYGWLDLGMPEIESKEGENK